MDILDKTRIIEILRDWNIWGGHLDTGYERRGYLEKLCALLERGMVTVVTGPRRSGKSYILRQLLYHLTRQGRRPQDTLFINFEDPRWNELSSSTIEQAFNVFLEHNQVTQRPLIILDEVQLVSGWERWVRSMDELGKAQIIISGSNATLLGGELATALGGRHLDLTVLPFSFAELLQARGSETQTILGSGLQHHLEAYIAHGGYPLVVAGGYSKELLLAYYDDIITRDIVRRYKVRKPEHLKRLSNFLLSNLAAHLTFNSLAEQLELSTDSILKYCQFLESSYLVFLIKRFSTKIKIQDNSARKIYCIDNGLANAIGFRAGFNDSKLLENTVATELLRRKYADPSLELYYWQDTHQKEIDFVLKRGSRVTELLQVCWDLTDPKTRKRELSALELGMRQFELKTATVITFNQEFTEQVDSGEIKGIRLADWLA